MVYYAMLCTGHSLTDMFSSAGGLCFVFIIWSFLGRIREENWNFQPNRVQNYDFTNTVDLSDIKNLIGTSFRLNNSSGSDIMYI